MLTLQTKKRSRITNTTRNKRRCVKQRARRMFFEALESRQLLTNTLYAAATGWHEWDYPNDNHDSAIGSDNGDGYPDTVWFERDVLEGPSPPSGLNSPTTCGAG